LTVKKTVTIWDWKMGNRIQELGVNVVKLSWFNLPSLQNKEYKCSMLMLPGRGGNVINLRNHKTEIIE
jgi:hypothetical protein